MANLQVLKPAPSFRVQALKGREFVTISSDELRGSGLRRDQEREHQRTVNVRPTARASTPPPSQPATAIAASPTPESGEHTTVSEWNESGDGRRPRASSPRFYEVAGPDSGSHAHAEGTAAHMPFAAKPWLPVPETQTNILVDPDERRTQATAVEADDEKPLS